MNYAIETMSVFFVPLLRVVLSVGLQLVFISDSKQTLLPQPDLDCVWSVDLLITILCRAPSQERGGVNALASLSIFVSKHHLLAWIELKLILLNFVFRKK